MQSAYKLQHLFAFHSFLPISTAAGVSPASKAAVCPAAVGPALAPLRCPRQPQPRPAAMQQSMYRTMQLVNFTTALCLPAVQAQAAVKQVFSHYGVVSACRAS